MIPPYDNHKPVWLEKENKGLGRKSPSQGVFISLLSFPFLFSSLPFSILTNQPIIPYNYPYNFISPIQYRLPLLLLLRAASTVDPQLEKKQTYFTVLTYLPTYLPTYLTQHQQKWAACHLAYFPPSSTSSNFPPFLTANRANRSNPSFVRSVMPLWLS